MPHLRLCWRFLWLACWVDMSHRSSSCVCSAPDCSFLAPGAIVVKCISSGKPTGFWDFPCSRAPPACLPPQCQQPAPCCCLWAHCLHPMGAEARGAFSPGNPLWGWRVPEVSMTYKVLCQTCLFYVEVVLVVSLGAGEIQLGEVLLGLLNYISA